MGEVASRVVIQGGGSAEHLTVVAFGVSAADCKALLGASFEGKPERVLADLPMQRLGSALTDRLRRFRIQYEVFELLIFSRSNRA